MVPLERLNALKALNPSDLIPKKAAVMMLFYPKNKETHLVLIVRNSYPGVHSSQIAFPGGKVEIEDASLAHTALRETEEEIGVDRNKIEIIKSFTDVYIPPSNFLVSFNSLIIMAVAPQTICSRTKKAGTSISLA